MPIKFLKLSLLFLACFAAPVAGGYYFFLAGHGRSGLTASGDKELFPGKFQVPSEGFGLYVKNNPQFDLANQEDLLIYFWLRLRSLPVAGKSLLVLRKLDGPHGWAVRLRRDDSLKLHFDAYISNRSQKGGSWYEFAPVDFSAREWVLVSLSVKEARYLGVHFAKFTVENKLDLQLLGGYDLEGMLEMNANSDIYFGRNDPSFSGDLGPLGVLKGKKFLKGLTRALRDLADNPEQPLKLGDAQLLLWLNNKKDLSPLANGVTVVGRR